MSKYLLCAASVGLIGLMVTAAPAAPVTWSGGMARDIAAAAAESKDAPLCSSAGAAAGAVAVSAAVPGVVAAALPGAAASALRRLADGRLLLNQHPPTEQFQRVQSIVWQIGQRYLLVQMLDWTCRVSCYEQAVPVTRWREL